MRKKKNTYLLIKGLFKGLAITLKHFLKPKNRVDKGIQSEDYFSQRTGSSTLRYPADQIPVPEVGRYQLAIEMNDCIVCDLCAKICPVDCIDIEAIKATEDIGKTSDGTTKRLHAAKFSIDMGKCMFCGLCTVVCPTECLVMTNEYDRSFTDPQDLNYVFAEMSDAEAAQKRELAAAAEQAKKDAKAAALANAAINKEGQI